MADNLRDRIAAAVARELVQQARDCGDYRDCLKVADAVIRELRLTPENSYGTTYPNVPIKDVTRFRYVTDWRAEN